MTVYLQKMIVIGFLKSEFVLELVFESNSTEYSVQSSK